MVKNKNNYKRNFDAFVCSKEAMENNNWAWMNINKGEKIRLSRASNFQNNNGTN